MPLDIPGVMISAAGKAQEIGSSKEVMGLLQKVIGPPADALAGLLSDKINERRHANLIAIAERAQAKLKKAGIEPNQVPLKIIHPLLEQASLKTEDELQERWAYLLASIPPAALGSRSAEDLYPACAANLRRPGALVCDGRLHHH